MSYAQIYPASANAQEHDDDGRGPARGPYFQDHSPLTKIADVLQAHALNASHALDDQTPAQQPQSQPQSQPPLTQQQQQQQQQKSNRLRKACDSCSIRKVKCDETGPPCRACIVLDIPCTFDRPSRRRGPPNRHAEDIKKRRLNTSDPHSAHSSPQSPTNAAHVLAQLQSSHPQLSAESICPLATMNSLIDDFFMYIHPLCPFPHEPSFREAWERREDHNNPAFLALLASMIAALVSSFPRKPRTHLKVQTRREYPSHLSLVERCREVCAQARGPGYLDQPTLSVYDACTSYFLGLTGAYVFQWRQLRLYFAECLTILRSLGLHKPEAQAYTHLGSMPSAGGSEGPSSEGSREYKTDTITEQLGRRVFWTVFVGARTIQQLGASYGELTIAPATSTEPLPPLPAEVDDVYIFPSELTPQPAGVVSLITGFNLNVRIYLSYSSLATAEMAFGVDELFDWDRQQRIFEQCMQRCRTILDSIPEVLKVQAKPERDIPIPQQRQPYVPPLPRYSIMGEAAANNNVAPELQDQRRYEIQKANVYASHLATRSYLVEKYFLQLDKFQRSRIANGQRSSPDALAMGLDRLVPTAAADADDLEKTMINEREQVVKDLLVVLGSIDMVNMEPNGDSFVSLYVHLQNSDFIYESGDFSISCSVGCFFRQNDLSPIASLRFFPTQTQKIRAIAKTLLEVPKERRGSVALQHQDYLYRFLDILSKLERVSPETSDPMSSTVDEETELRLWADLRDHQLKFQEQGGVYGFS